MTHFPHSHLLYFSHICNSSLYFCFSLLFSYIVYRVYSINACTTDVYHLYSSLGCKLEQPRNTSDPTFLWLFCPSIKCTFFHHHHFNSMQHYLYLLMMIHVNTTVYIGIVLHLCPTGNSPDCAQVLFPFQHGQVHTHTHTHTHARLSLHFGFQRWYILGSV